MGACRAAVWSAGYLPLELLGGTVQCKFSSADDTNGVLYHLATRGGTREYRNPHEAGEVVVSMSSVFDSYGPSHFVEHQAKNCACTQNQRNPWIAVDLGQGRSLRPSHYRLQRGYLCSWELQGSADGVQWHTIKRHKETPSHPAAWTLKGGGRAYRHFRILQTSKNSFRNHNLCCGGLELYGELIDAASGPLSLGELPS